MKLINATKLKTDLQENFCKYTITCDECSKMFGEELCEIINKQTTAYDVDKVIEQIKEQDEVCTGCKHTDECNECSIGERIEIIKRGGLDEN